MTDHPILFNGEQVRAVLAGRQTMTRRVVKGTALEWLQYSQFTPEYVALPENRLCPYGIPGDRLWVRETWQGIPCLHCDLGHESCHCTCSDPPLYRADNPEHPRLSKWRPSIHMPRWASRLTLEVTGVRVERVQEINSRDAIAEGICFESPWGADTDITDFAALWDSINAKRGYGWEANPWVWVVEFRRVEG